jgi:hypothetical protein
MQSSIMASNLRYVLKNPETIVYAVAFQDSVHPRYSDAAIISITDLPGKLGDFDNCIGADRFLFACQANVCGQFKPISLSEPKPARYRTLDHALEFSRADPEEVKA